MRATGNRAQQNVLQRKHLSSIKETNVFLFFLFLPQLSPSDKWLARLLVIIFTDPRKR